MAESPNQLGLTISTEVTRAETDYQNVRSRALSVIGLSGGLVALVSGSIAIAAGSNKVDFAPLPARIALLLALLSFIVASVLALLINRPGTVNALTADELKDYAENHWDDDGWDQQTAVYLTSYLGSLRISNDSTASKLTTAIWFEIAGVALTGLTALLIMYHLPTSTQPVSPVITVPWGAHSHDGPRMFRGDQRPQGSNSAKTPSTIQSRATPGEITAMEQ
jgi:hypothetical protein